MCNPYCHHYHMQAHNVMLCGSVIMVGKMQLLEYPMYAIVTNNVLMQLKVTLWNFYVHTGIHSNIHN